MRESVLKEQALLHMWFQAKYLNSSCEDEAIDWSQHPDTLNIEELEEYINWREAYLSTIEYLWKLTENSTLFYACRPWSAAKDNKVVTILNKEE